MRSRPQILVLAALALVAAVGCGSSSPAPAPGTTGATSAATAPAPTPAAAAGRSPVTVLSSSVAATADHVAVALRLRQPADVDPPVARTARLVLAKGVTWRGGAAPSCDAATLARGGPAGCPKASIIGSGTATGVADTSPTVGSITVVNGGADHVYLATTVLHPAYVKTVVAGRIAPVGGGGGGLRLDLTFPKDLQTIAGVPVGLQQLRLTIDRGPALSVAACPSTGWAYDATVAFDDGTHAQQAGRATCTG